MPVRLPFPTWSARDASAALESAASVPPLASAVVFGSLTRDVGGYSDPRAGVGQRAATRERLRLYLLGDHWQNGDGWPGPPNGPERDTADGAAAMADLRDAFTFRNVVREISDRAVDGVLGREPQWGFVSRTAETTAGSGDAGSGTAPRDTAATRAAGELSAALTEWWDRERVGEKLARAAAFVLWSERTALRIRALPEVTIGGTAPAPGAATAADRARGDTRTLVARPRAGESRLAAALRLFSLDVPEPGQAAVYIDPRSNASAAIYADAVTVGPTASAGTLGVVGGTATRMRYEIAYVDPSDPAQPLTRLRIVADTASDEASGETWSARLGGRLPIFELERPALLGEDMASMQAALNLALTCMMRREVSAAWLEEYLLNAKVPGHYEAIAGSADGRTRFVPEPIVRGPGVRQYVQGAANVDTQGNVTHATPQVVHRQPVEANPSTVDAIYAAMLDAADQSHILAAGVAGSSGEEHRQRRANYVRSLRKTAKAVDAAGRWILETVTAFAEDVLNTPGQYTNALRAWMQCRLDAGPVPADEQTANASAVGAGLMSAETAMARNDVEDPAAELALIRDDAPYRLTRGTAILTGLGLATAAQVPDEVAYALLGITDDEQKAIDDARKAADRRMLEEGAALGDANPNVDTGNPGATGNPAGNPGANPFATPPVPAASGAASNGSGNGTGAAGA